VLSQSLSVHLVNIAGEEKCFRIEIRGAVAVTCARLDADLGRLRDICDKQVSHYWSNADHPD
jgi:hypothetical protein